MKRKAAAPNPLDNPQPEPVNPLGDGPKPDAPTPAQPKRHKPRKGTERAAKKITKGR